MNKKEQIIDAILFAVDHNTDVDNTFYSGDFAEDVGEILDSFNCTDGRDYHYHQKNIQTESVVNLILDNLDRIDLRGLEEWVRENNNVI